MLYSKIIQYTPILPVSVEPVQEVLDRVCHPVGLTDVAHFEDGLGHQRHRVQVPPPDHVHCFCKAIQIFRGSLLLLVHQ